MTADKTIVNGKDLGSGVVHEDEVAREYLGFDCAISQRSPWSTIMHMHPERLRVCVQT